MTALAKTVYVGGVAYVAGTDHTVMPPEAVDRIRNPEAWVGGVVPPVSAASWLNARIELADLGGTVGQARAALGLGASAGDGTSYEVNVKTYGAKGDVQGGNSSAISAGQKTLTVSGGIFQPGDTGKIIAVAGAGTSGAALITTIASRISPTQVTLQDAAVTTVTTSNCLYGTDDSTAVAAAIEAVRVTGGILRFPPGGFFVHGLRQHTGVHWWGAGIGGDQFSTTRRNALSGTWLIATPGSNDDIVRTVNFETLTGGTVNTGAPSRFGFHGLVFDGGRLNGYNTAGWCARLFGSSYQVEEVIFQYGPSGGVFAEWGNGGSDMEAMWDRWFIKECGGSGLELRGPHDSIFDNGIVTGSGAGTRGVYIPSGKAAGYNFSNVHVWGSFDWCWDVRTGGELINCKGEGATIGQLLLGGGFTHVVGGAYFNGLGATAAGIQIGDTNLFPSHYSIDTSLFDVRVPIKVVNDSGYGAIRAKVTLEQSGDTPLTGSLQDSTEVRIVSDLALGGVHEAGGQYYLPGKVTTSSKDADGLVVKAQSESAPRLRVDATIEATNGVLTVRSSSLATGTPDIARFLNKSGNLMFAVTETGPLWGASTGFGVIRNAGGRTSLRMQDTANGINFPQVGNAVTGSAPYFGVEGSDTNIDVQLKPKGSGATALASGPLKMPNVSAEPGTPSGGGTLFVQDGALKYKGSNGTVTSLAPA